MNNQEKMPDKAPEADLNESFSEYVPLNMYQIPGFDAPNFEQYMRCKSQDKEIEKLVKEATLNVDLCDKLLNTAPTERLSVIHEILKSEQPEAEIAAGYIINRLKPEEQFGVIEKLLKGHNAKAQIMAVRRSNVSTGDLRERSKKLFTNKLKEGLTSNDPDAVLEVAWLVNRVSENEQEIWRPVVSQKVLQFFNSNDLEQQKKSLSMLEFCLTEDATPIVKEALANENIDIKRIAASKIAYTEKDEMESLIRIALNEKDEEVRLNAVNSLRSASLDTQAKIIKEVLRNDESIKVQTEAAKLTEYFKGSHVNQLQPLMFGKIAMAFNKPGIEGLEFVEMSHYLNSEQTDNFRPLALRKFNEVFEEGNSEEKKKVLKLIPCSPKEQRLNMIKRVLSENNADIFKSLVKLFGPSYFGGELGRLYSEKTIEFFNDGRGGELINPPLYDDYPEMNNEEFRRQKFEKTGSGTTLVGGSLKDKLIIRHIQPAAFVAWQRAYEDFNLWAENGFDYVPIEPIQSYRLNKNELVDVFSGVLDINYSDWGHMSGGMFADELNEKRKKIESILKKQGIKHGHTHSYNFSLRFFRDENGNPTLEKSPQIYLIDFDQAVSPGSQLKN